MLLNIWIVSFPRNKSFTITWAPNCPFFFLFIKSSKVIQLSLIIWTEEKEFDLVTIGKMFEVIYENDSDFKVKPRVVRLTTVKYLIMTDIMLRREREDQHQKNWWHWTMKHMTIIFVGKTRIGMILNKKKQKKKANILNVH